MTLLFNCSREALKRYANDKINEGLFNEYAIKHELRYTTI
jgi:hypothetical protein